MLDNQKDKVVKEAGETAVASEKNDSSANTHKERKLVAFGRKKEEKSDEEIALEEKQEFVKRVLEDDENQGVSITRAFRSSKNELAITSIIANAERYEPDHMQGLTKEQADKQILLGLQNKAVQTSEKTYGSIFAQNFLTFFNLLVVVVAAALIYVRAYSDLLFLVLAIINSCLGVFQEIKAKKMVAKLSIISAPVAIVVRGGERITIPVEEIVLDDIMFLENGKQICADAIVRKGKIEVNESLLTGESALVTKKEGDVLYAGSYVSSGSCYAKVEKVGNANYIESLTSFAKKYKKARSELLNSLKRIVSAIGVIVVPIAILMFYNNLRAEGKHTFLEGLVTPDVVGKTAGAIIGMIPAGMFLLTSIALAACVVNLARNRVLVQDLYCIEMLARTNILCLDKTGTITDGTMRVSEVISFKNPTDYNLNDIIGSILTATGDNNQTAMALANHFGYSKALKPTMISPFSSQKKLSAATFEGVGTFIMGAPEFVSPEMDVKLQKIITDKAKDGLRIMLLAHTVSEIKSMDRLPAGRKPLAVICIEDHIREDAVQTIKWFKDNDVKVKVISGDNPVTVSEVARRVGIENAELYISLEGLSDQDVVEIANQYTVFGRVTPEQKRILVRAMKAKGNTVAMTGDGVNDILALKEADCSVAMATGSEAARNVSHMVLMDSNFSSMPTVVLEGRRVINNITKSASLFLMKTIFSFMLSIVVIVMGFSGAGFAYPISPRNLILLELFIIGIPSFALAFQSNSKRLDGRFLSNVIREAFPGGFSLLIGFLALVLFKGTSGLLIMDNSYKSMAVIIITFIAWVMLLRMCQPLNVYRSVLCSASLAMCIVSVLLSMGGGWVQTAFGITSIGLTETLFVLVVILSSYAFATVVSKFLSNIKIE